MNSFLSDIRGIINSFDLYPDLVDILIVAFIFYYVIRLVRETGAFQLLKGVLILFLLYGVALVLQFRSLSFLIRNVFNYGVFALLIVLQPELRHSLERIGRTNLAGLLLFGSDEAEKQRIAGAIRAVGEATAYLSKRRIGALIVFERETRLGEIVKSGTVIDAVPSAEIIGNIFFVNSPLHDGALIVRDGRLHAAGCYLPLSENYTISKEMGTRHRAALGMSEKSDAVIVVVSEETGALTIAENGHLRRGFTSEQIVEELTGYLLPEREEKTEKRFLFPIKVKKNDE